jgi:hypothetical protein
MEETRLEDRISLVLNALSQSERPLWFDEIMAETNWHNEGDTALALGTLAARGQIGQSLFFGYVIKERAISDIAMPPFWYDTTLEALEEGPVAFLEIADRVTTLQSSEIGFALGWLYAEGKAVLEDDCWRLVEKEEG